VERMPVAYFNGGDANGHGCPLPGCAFSAGSARHIDLL
jgi:hypothetical protein